MQNDFNSETKFSSGTGYMFTVTPENIDSSDKEPVRTSTVEQSILDNFRKQAEDDGYPSDLVSKALELVNEDTRSYEDFESLIDKVMDKQEAAELEAAKKRARIKKSIDMEIRRLEQVEDIAQYCDNLINKHYRTSAVTTMDLVKLSTTKELKLELFKEPVYSIIIQIKRDWVSNHVSEVLAAWETSEFPKKFVEEYLVDIGVTKDAFDKNKSDLVKMLPTNIQNEKSPDTYKQFRTVQLLLQQNNADDSLSRMVLGNRIQNIEYGAALEKGIEDGMPALAAQAYATQMAVKSMPASSRPIGLAGAAGAFCGKVISIKYKAAKNFDDMMRESLGEYYADYDSNKELVKQRKAELKERKQLQRQQQQQQTVVDAQNIQQQVNVKPQQRQQQRPQQAKLSQPTKQEVRDFNPDIPVPVIVAIVNIVVGLLTLALFGKTTGTFAAIGLIIAFVGFLIKETGGDKALLTILGGYGLYLVAVILVFI